MIYRLSPFPTLRRDAEACKRWKKAVNRCLYHGLYWSLLRKCVCSDHFMDGGLTTVNPDPTLHPDAMLEWAAKKEASYTCQTFLSTCDSGYRWSIDHRVNFLLTLPISPKDKCVSSLWGFITTSIMLLIIAVLIMLLQNATNVAKTALTENDKLRMEIKSCSTQSLGLEYHFLVTWIRQLVTRTWTWNSPLRDWTTSGVPQSCRTWTWTLVRLESCFWRLRLEIASLVTRTLTHHFWTRLQLWKSLN